LPDTPPPAVTEDRLLGGRLAIRQPKDGFRVAIDTVLLAAAVPAQAGERVFEPGAGVGAAALCLAARVEGVRVSGIEPQAALVRLAGENARLNGLYGAVEVMAGAIGAALPPRVAGPFDHVMANPPFLEDSRAQKPQDEGRAAAHVEGEAGLADWCACAHTVLRRGGSLTLIHRADRLEDVLAALGDGWGGVTVFPLWPRTGQAARRIIVRAHKGSKAPLALAAGLALHVEGANGYTPEADAVLRGGALSF
jgi:tRNA1(Val) A37 N6-methylase TrmN6